MINVPLWIANISCSRHNCSTDECTNCSYVYVKHTHICVCTCKWCVNNVNSVIFNKQLSTLHYQRNVKPPYACMYVSVAQLRYRLISTNNEQHKSQHITHTHIYIYTHCRYTHTAIEYMCNAMKSALTFLIKKISHLCWYMALKLRILRKNRLLRLCWWIHPFHIHINMNTFTVQGIKGVFTISIKYIMRIRTKNKTKQIRGIAQKQFVVLTNILNTCTCIK